MIIETLQDFGFCVRKARKLKGWTQREMAQRFNSVNPRSALGVQQISRIENGRTNTTLCLVVALCMVLDIKIKLG